VFVQKLYSQLVGMPVVDVHTGARLSSIKSLIIDPENGKILAFLLPKDKIIVPIDVSHLSNGLYIAHKDHIISIDDVLRVSRVAKQNIHLVGLHVVTEKHKQDIGTVLDYEVDATHMALSKLYVAKSLMLFHYQQRIIGWPSIIRITSTEIVVKEMPEVTVKEEAVARSSAFAA